MNRWLRRVMSWSFYITMSPGFKSEKETKLASAHLLSLAKDVVDAKTRKDVQLDPGLDICDYIKRLQDHEQD